ncbi:hypothetical protein G6K72_000825 [Salmonella enterica subsp. enterica serovar Rubislaw]|nr:hypothetical protein [Salmonella enterica subsp. enterica serovar Rubislaw]
MNNTEVEQIAEEVAPAIRVQAQAAKAVTTLKAAIEANTSSNSVICLQDMPVDTFTSVSSYENNRDVEARAIKQAKKDGSHHTSAMVAIAVLDPERNAALWKRTEKVAADQGIPHTLPFIKVDGHTRSYGWSVVRYENDKTCKNLTTLEDLKAKGSSDTPPYLFTRPDYLLITVHRDMTDDQIHELVHNYCDGVNKANNAELQQMGMKKVEFDPQSDFLKKDSWKTAFRTVDTANGKKSMEALIELYRKQLEAIDALKIDTKNTAKKLSGVRAALIATYSEKDCDKWIAFWEDFYQVEPESKKIQSLVSQLGELKTGNAAGALDLCVKIFKQFKL